jgi:integrase
MGSIYERPTKAGKVVYDASVRRKGAKKIYRTFNRLTDARNWILDTESDLRNGRKSSTTEPESTKHTLNDAIDRYLLDELPKKPRCLKDQTRHLYWFKKEAGYRFLSDINPALLTELKSNFLRGVTRFKRAPRPQSWNRYISSLSCVFQCCVRDWEWLETNPARRVRREREAPGRIRFLSDEERNRLLDACKQSESRNLYPYVVLALSTGMRRSEIRFLTWEQVDLSKGILILKYTKNGTHRRVPICGLALTLLNEHSRVRSIASKFVFPVEQRVDSGTAFNPDIYWYRALKEANISDFRFHDLRHSTASYLAMNGTPLLDIAEILGHKTLQMVKRYSHLSESHVTRAVQSMNEKIFGNR